MNKWFLGIDVGGTTVKMAFLDEEAVIHEKWEIKTDLTDGGSQIVADISNSVAKKMQTLNISAERLIAAGIGAPGYIDVKNGIIVEAVNVGWRDYPVSAELSNQLGIPVYADNDANLAAAGEKWKGAGDGAEELLAVTLGTGVGGGIIAENQIVHGFAGLAGEIGHITSVKEGGARCNCGKTGCLETVSSATGIVRLAEEALAQDTVSELQALKKEGEQVSAKDVFDAALNEDKLAVSVIETAMDHLGLALANLANSLNPERIVIGGGVSKAGEVLLDYIRPSFDRYTIPKISRETSLHIATLGNDAGVIGAAWLAKQNGLEEAGSR
ncbi:ROK family glucokinase [Salisediminibacterium halotolerans]|uniref:Glucokinase n=1 Tax=Salisediminibacterium halotolerans TaxID=517425 RepID=A0A1H9SAI4_9BACI|nr:ROK family glucokinase [Salisediminibacterium haloalkalitolerans]SER82014.1 glucokinase [Salisediminibacterium haloalkalitolerans]